MKRSLLGLIAGSLLLTALDCPAATLDDANRLFADAKYKDSTAAYGQVIAERGYSAPVLFDLGNSLYRQGDFAQAIVAYKRAQQLAPDDADIAANLETAQKAAGLSPVPRNTIQRLARVLSLNEWAWLGCGAWTVLCLALLARVAVPRMTGTADALASVAVLVLAVVVAATVVSSRSLREAVVTSGNASALISPFPAAGAAFSPPAGAVVTIEKRYGDYLLVRDAGHRSGWIAEDEVTPVIPPANAKPRFP